MKMGTIDFIFAVWYNVFKKSFIIIKGGFFVTERVYFGECAVDVFVMDIADVQDVPITDAKRVEYIEKATDSRTRGERRAAWQLLLMGLKARRIDPETIKIRREECGRWVSENLCFSLSHTRDVVAVAIADKPVGIDVEKISERDITALSRRALTDAEREELERLSPEDRLTRFYEIWCKKESFFKTLGEDVFLPNRIESAKTGAQSRIIEIGGKRFAVAVAVKDSEQ